MQKTANRELDDTKYRKIPSLQFLYEVNFYGKVRNVKSKRFLKQHKTYRGYWMVYGSIKGKRFYKTVHSVVAECWIGLRPDGSEIDHIDRNKDNNRADNLRYVTHKENNLNREFPWSVGVEITNGEETKVFNTSKECANYISSQTGKPWGGIRNRLFKRRKHIHGFDIRYLSNEETEHGSLNRQETVHSNVYLVGSLDRWNNAKRAEEHDRVKHGVE